MKKVNKILIIIFTILLMIFACLLILKPNLRVFFYKDIEFDRISITCTNIKDFPTIEKGNLKVTLKAFYLETPANRETMISDLDIENHSQDIEKIHNSMTGEMIDRIDYFLETDGLGNKNIDAVLEFSSINNENITSVDFGYLIYDNQKNILAYSDNYKDTQPEIENYLAKEIFDADNRFEFGKYFSSRSSSIDNFITKDNFSLRCIHSHLNTNKTPKENIELSDLHILIINPNYRDDKDKAHRINSTIFEFILDVK